MSKTMVEQVAKALYAHESGSEDGWDGPLLQERGREMWRKTARAAISAMRGPITPEMGLAFARYSYDNYRTDHVLEDTPAQDCWNDMIDEALK